MPQTKIKALAPQDLAAFFASTTMLLRAGVPANECPAIIADDMKGSRVSVAAQRMAALFEAGDVFYFSDVMEQAGGFPEYAVEMTRLAEESGRLEATLDSLSGYYRRQQELAQTISSAISGPLLLLVIMSAVLLVLVFIVLPVFEEVFASLGVVGGGIGGAFLATRIAMGVVGVLLVLLLALMLLYLLPGGTHRLSALAEFLPFTRRIHYAVSASRLTNGLRMLLASGISPMQALQKAGTLVDNKHILAQMPACQKAVDEGEDIGKALVRCGVLEGFEAKILISASRAGQTEQAMDRLSTIYADEANNGIDRLLGMLEPALVGILSVAIGVILLAVMLPLTRILTAVA